MRVTCSIARDYIRVLRVFVKCVFVRDSSSSSPALPNNQQFSVALITQSMFRGILMLLLLLYTSCTRATILYEAFVSDDSYSSDAYQGSVDDWSRVKEDKLHKNTFQKNFLYEEDPLNNTLVITNSIDADIFDGARTRLLLAIYPHDLVGTDPRRVAQIERLQRVFDSFDYSVSFDVRATGILNAAGVSIYSTSVIEHVPDDNLNAQAFKIIPGIDYPRIGVFKHSSDPAEYCAAPYVSRPTCLIIPLESKPAIPLNPESGYTEWLHIDHTVYWKSNTQMEHGIHVQRADKSLVFTGSFIVNHTSISTTLGHGMGVEGSMHVRNVRVSSSISDFDALPEYMTTSTTTTIQLNVSKTQYMENQPTQITDTSGLSETEIVLVIVITILTYVMIISAVVVKYKFNNLKQLLNASTQTLETVSPILTSKHNKITTSANVDKNRSRSRGSSVYQTSVTVQYKNQTQPQYNAIKLRPRSVHTYDSVHSAFSESKKEKRRHSKRGTALELDTYEPNQSIPGYGSVNDAMIV